MEKAQTLLQALGTLPDTLYHYTTMGGLLGIVQTGQIWASHIRFLNDRSEQEHIWSLVKSRIREKILSCDHPKVKASLEALSRAVELRTSDDAFVASFSGDGDMLSQWLSYCPEGNGFAIGFGRGSMISNNAIQFQRAVDLIAGGQLDAAQPGLGPVFYLSTENREFLDALLEQYRGARPMPDLFPNLDNSRVTETMRALLTPSYVAYRLLAFLESSVKDASFSAEKEYRLVLKGRPQKVLFRDGKSMLIPYTEYELDKSGGYFVERVIVGPCPDPDLSVKSVKMLFQWAGHPSVEVIKSKVPYRSW
jgi:hypothetical protein